MLIRLYKNTRLLMIYCLLFVANNTVTAAESDLEEEIDEPRWFEIEIIVYKPKSNQGFNDESWDKDLTFTPSDQQIDFIQPYYLSDTEACFVKMIENKQECVIEADLNSTLSPSLNKLTDEATGKAPPSAIDNNTNQEINMPDNSVIDIYSLDEEALLLSGLNQPIEEKPFQLLSEDQLQLSNEAASLRRHPEYQVLTHMAWRQPVLSRSEALSIRIAGGQDLSDTYKYNGNSRLSQSDPATSTLDGTKDSQEIVQFNAEQITNNSVNALKLKNNSQLKIVTSNHSISEVPTLLGQDFKTEQLDNVNLPLAIPNLWVPELDGDIKIHLNRFLHVTTNLFLRKPDKEEIEAAELDLYTPELLEKFSVDSTVPLLPSQSENATESSILSSPFDEASPIAPLEQEINPNILSDKKPHQFSWEISDNFLDTESEKIYIERLFNFSLKQSRKVRSGELHFFDHPLLGLFIIIRPYELPTKIAEEVNN